MLHFMVAVFVSFCLYTMKGRLLMRGDGAALSADVGFDLAPQAGRPLLSIRFAAELVRAAAFDEARTEARAPGRDDGRPRSGRRILA